MTQESQTGRVAASAVALLDVEAGEPIWCLGKGDFPMAEAVSLVTSFSRTKWIERDQEWGSADWDRFEVPDGAYRYAVRMRGEDHALALMVAVGEANRDQAQAMLAEMEVVLEAAVRSRSVHSGEAQGSRYTGRDELGEDRANGLTGTTGDPEAASREGQ